MFQNRFMTYETESGKHITKVFKYSEHTNRIEEFWLIFIDNQEKMFSSFQDAFKFLNTEN